jgi:small subunit ribosomal protein S5
MAKQHMVSVSLRDSTIPHEILCRHGGAKVLLRPASPGTGLIAGKTVRAVLESVGVKDVLTKSLGSNNPSNVLKATIAGLQQLRLREDIYRGRGLEVKPRNAPKPVAAPIAVAAPVAPVAPAAPVEAATAVAPAEVAAPAASAPPPPESGTAPPAA